MYSMQLSYEFLGLLKKWFKETNFRVVGNITNDIQSISKMIGENNQDNQEEVKEGG